MNNPIVSVIISTHNRAERLKKAIQSVLDQSFQDFEIVVVDDASTDNTETIVKLFDDERIVYKKREHNFGNDTKPKNEGFVLSKGKYVCFLDDDNTYRKDHLLILFNEIEKGGNDVVYGDRWIIDETGQITPRVGISSDFNPFVLMQQNYIDTGDALIKREAFKTVGGFDERYKKYVDWNLWIRMNKYGFNFKRVPQIISDYYICSDSKSLRKEDEQGFLKPAWNPYDCEIELDTFEKKSEPKIAIFSITYDRLKLTKECFPSLHETAEYPFDHFIVDNGSKDGTQGYLIELQTKYPNTTLILNEDNKGISIASNQALDTIGNKYQIIVKVDNDAYFKNKGWLKRMVQIWKSNHRIALSCYIEGLRDNPGGAKREVYGNLCGEYVGITKHLGGICHFVDARAYKNFRWDNKSALHGIQDLELSQHLNTNGFQMGYLENWFCEHRYGTEGQHNMFPEYFERRKKEKMTAYQGIVDINTKEHWNTTYENEGHEDPQHRNDLFSFEIVKNEIKDEGKLLDVGCGKGLLLEYLETFFPKLEMHGVDLSEKGIELAKCKAKLQQAEITKLPFEDETFDYTVSTEVLEHIVELEKALSEISRVTKTGGKTIHMFPYKDTVPSDEHVNEFDEESVLLTFNKYFREVEVTVNENPHFVYGKGSKLIGNSKLILMTGIK